MRNGTTWKRILSLVLCLALVVSFMPSTLFGGVSAAAAGTFTKIADPSTMDDWKNFFGPDMLTTEFSGGVWTDKSVFTDASAFSGVTMKGENNFLVALSAISATTEIKGQSTTPTDVMLVLDLSNSMDNSGSIPDMIAATNKAIHTLLTDNNYNRVGVVLYSGNSQVGNSAVSTATVILPLDRYTTGTNEAYLAYTGSRTNTTVTVDGSVRNSAGNRVTGSKRTDGGTYIQNGLFQAWQQFEAVTDTKVSEPGSNMHGIQRMPILVLMSDGAPTAATTNYFGTTTTNWQGQTTTSIGTSNNGDGTSSNNTRVFLTQLTAAWVEASIASHYGTDAKFYTLGLGTGSDTNATGVLLPSGSNNTLVSWWNSYLRLNDGATLNTNGAPRVTRKAIVPAMNYVDQYWYASDSSELIDKFDSITGQIQLQAASFSTLVEAAGSDLSGYVSFEDEIDELMHIQHVKGIVLDGVLYTGIEVAKAFVNGTFGAIGNPTEKGEDFTATMCERIGIDASTAHQLAQQAYAAKQLYYDAATGTYSNYIGWYSDANGDYLGFWQEAYGFGMENAPSGAVYINKSYGYLGENGTSDMMHVVVNTRMEIATSHQDVLFKVPAGMLPMVTYEIDLEGSDVTSGGTMTYQAATPIRLLYEVGLRSDINAVNIDQKVEEYLAANENHHVHKNADGTYSFYTNAWGDGHNSSTNPTISTGLLPYVTESHFSPAVDNERYYYTEDTPIYVKSGDSYVRYTGDTVPSGTGYYRTRIVITAAQDGGQITVTEKYLPISERILADGYVTKTTDGWVVDEGVAFREVTRFEIAKSENRTGTLQWADHPLVVFTGAADASYDIYAVLGNNGKLTVSPAQGIKVSKTVAEKSDDYAAPTEFDFEITLKPAVAESVLQITDADGNPWAEEDYTITVDSIGNKTVVELSLADGEEVFITGLPDGTEYTVEEHQTVYYNTEYTDDLVTGTVVPYEITHVPFVNAPRELEELQITKTVLHPFAEDPAALENKTFYAKVTLTDKASGHEFTDSNGKKYTADATGSFVVELKDESSVTIVDILEDTPYTVTEVNIPEGFALVEGQSSGLTGTVPGTAHIVNEYVPTPPAENPDVTVTVNKRLEGNYSGPETFVFRLEMLDAANANADADGYVLVSELEVEYPTANSVSYDISSLVETFDEIGSHTFRIMEVTGDTVGMTYSIRRATFRVDVVDPEMDGKLSIDVVELANTVVTENGSVHTVAAEFENIYAVDSTYVDVPVNKTLVNNTGVAIDLSGFQFGLFTTPEGTTPVADTTVYAGPTGAATIRIPVTSLDQHGDVYYLKEIVPASARAGMTYSAAVYKVTLSVSSHEGASGAYLQASAAIVPYSGGGAVSDGSATFTNTFDLGEVSASIVGDKTLVRGYDDTEMAVSAGDYTFQLWTANADYTTGTLLQTVKNGADGTINFAAMDYTKVGPYYYIIREVKGSNSAITYDAHDVYVLVNVTEDGNGGLTAAVYYRKSTENVGSTQANFTNTYNVTGTDTVSVSGSKVLEVLQGSKTLVGGEFTFELKNSSGTVVDTATNAPNGKFTFDALTFSAADVGKTFTYTVTEAKGSNAGMAYDETVFTFTVEVKDMGDGTIDAVYTLTGATEIKFVNKYTAKSTTASFNGTKTLTGRDTAMQAGEFTFELYKTDKDFANRVLLKEITHDADGKFSFETEEYTAVGTYYYVLEEQIPEDRPGGMHYDAGEYRLTVQVTDNGNGQLIATKTVYRPGSSSTAIAFSNSYEAEPVDVELTATKTYDKTLTGGEFTFVLKDADGFELQKVTNAAGGAVTFEALTFEQEGTYTYTVSEVPNGLAYITDDTTVYTVVITVTDDNAGNLVAEVKVDGVVDGEMNFTNTYKFVNGADLNLTGTKTLTGRDMIAEEFTFEVKEGDKVVSTGLNDASGVITFSTIEYTEADIGTHTYTIYEVAGSKGGVTYDDKEYTITVEVADDGKGGLTVTRVNGSNDVVLTWENEYTITGTADLTLEAAKVLDGKTLEADQFSFVLEDRDGNVLDTKTNAADGKIVFKTLTYTAADIGTHHYEVAEIAGNAGGITYDQTVYYVTVTVSDNGEGGLNVRYTVGGAENGPMVFTNRYSTSGDVTVPISGFKELTGNRTQLADKEFTFLLLDENKQEIDRTKNNTDGTFSFDPQTFDTAGIYTFYVVELDEGREGFTYDATEFKVVITVEDNGEGGLRAVKTIDEKQNAPIHFTNKYEITGEAEVTLEGKKNLAGRDLNDGEFTFHVHEGDTIVVTGTNDASGKITFPAIKYTAADIGTHTYIVHEVTEQLGGVTYDTARHTVTVVVSDNGQGGLKTEVTGMADLVFNNTYVPTGDTKVQLSGTKVLEYKTLEDGMFSFELVENGQVIQTVQNVGGTFTFEELVYTKAGKHEYTIREVQGTMGGVFYDQTEYKVSVDVYDNGAGGFSANVTGLKDAQDVNVVVFHNTYTVSGTAQTVISGDKTLSGDRDTVKEGEFSFQLIEGNTVLQTVKNKTDGSFTFKPLTYTADQVGNTFTYTVKEVNEGKGGYSYDGNVYTVIVKVVDNGDGTIRAEQTIENAQRISFENTYNITVGAELILEGTKTMTGDRNTMNPAEYEFVVMEDGKQVAKGYNDAQGKITFETITYTGKAAIGTHTYTVYEVKGDKGGVTYSDAVYTVVVTVSDNGEGGLAVEKTTLPELNFTNAYNIGGTGELKLTATKELTVKVGTKTMEAGEFKFVVMDGQQQVSQGTNDAQGNVVFDTITYTKDDIGEHTYIISEVKGENGGMTYTTTTYEVKVVVSDNGKGGLTVTHTIDGAADKPILFENTYEVTGTGEMPISGVKVLTGRPLQDGEFSFTLKKQGDDGQFADVETVQNTTGGAINFTTLQFGPGDIGQHTYTVSEVDNGKGGVEYDSTVYTVVITVTDNGNGGITVTKSVDGKTDKDIIFRNGYEAEGEDTVTIAGVKHLNGGFRDTVQDQEFTFVLKDAAGTAIETVKNNADGSFTFTGLKFTHADIAGSPYLYTVSEEAGTTGGMTYTDKVFNVKITVEDDLLGGIKVTKYVDDATTNAITFTNTYTVTGSEDVVLSGTKVMEGDRNKADDQEFSFVLKDAAGIEVETVKNKADGTFQFSPLTFTQDHIKGSPYHYTVTEVPTGNNAVDYSNEIYNVVVTVSDNGNGGITVETTVNNVVDGDISFTNTYTITGTADLDLEGTKALSGDRTVQTAGEFKFLVMEGDKQVSKGTNDADGKIVFDTITYTKADIGTHTYVVSEEKGTNAGMTYDETTYTVIVEVADDKQGGLTVTRTADPALNFTNTYTITGTGELILTGDKTLTGHREVQVAGEFKFVVKENGTEVSKGTNDAQGNIAFETINYTKADIGEHTYEITEINEGKGGISYDTTVYTVKVKVSDNGNGGLLVERTENPTVSFRNTYEISKPGQLQLTGTKALANRAQTEGEFTFTVMEGDKVVATGKNDVQGNIVFTPITYTADDRGEHTYVITEDKGTLKGVTYDETSYKVIVKVEDDGEGGLTVSKLADPVIMFHNVYTPDEKLTMNVVKKVVTTSNDPVSAKGFEFNLIDGETGKVLQTAASDENGLAAFEMVYTLEDAGKTFAYKITEVQGKKTGWTYDTTEYLVTVEVKKGQDGKLTIAKTVNEAEAEQISVSFTNTYKPSVTPPTGDDFRPVLVITLMLLAALGVVVTLILRRRRTA